MRSVAYRDEADYARMRRLLQRAWSASGPHVLMTVGDLDFWRHQRDAPPLERTCRLWLDATDDAVGFAWASSGVGDLAVAPGAASILGPMMDWVEETLLGTQGTHEVTMFALDSDFEHQAELARRGYRRTDAFHHWYHVRSIADPVAAPALPSGFVLRTVSEARAADHVAALLDRTGASPPFTSDGWRSLMSSPTYRAELDLLVIAAGGLPVAHCTGWLDSENGALLLEPLGCDPGTRRRGLARALVLEMLRRGRGL